MGANLLRTIENDVRDHFNKINFRHEIAMPVSFNGDYLIITEEFFIDHLKLSTEITPVINNIYYDQRTGKSFVDPYEWNDYATDFFIFEIAIMYAMKHGISKERLRNLKFGRTDLKSDNIVKLNFQYLNNKLIWNI